MPETKIKTILKLKRGSANGWAETDTILEEGEPGYDNDNKSLKIGDGQSSWSELPTFLTDNSTQITHLNNATINNYVVAVDNNDSILKILLTVSAGDLAVLSPSKVYIPADWSILSSGAFAGLTPGVLYIVDDSINGQTFDPTDYGGSSASTVSYNYDINNVILMGLKNMMDTIGTLNTQLEQVLNGGSS